ncbi:hypothetical protein RHGRI_000359 [Rhododendron griersonianum]|uniref:GH18 domain-containing protein n=1 Tax=Rhododendron griersonianum TaxID=479676 RepID=A0AAV6LGN3_9ERIC|nr:hypothetical protein RHGRI_000359 [Rhododendron griersonianum]
MESIRRNFDWVLIVSFFYHLPTMENFTGAHSALYDPSSNVSTDYGIKEWISRGLPAKKMVLGLPYHGYAWTLLDPSANEIGSPATGPAVTLEGSMFYKFIKSYMQCDGEKVVYNSTYVTNYGINGSVRIGYDDVEAIRTKGFVWEGERASGLQSIVIKEKDQRLKWLKFLTVFMAID